MADLKNLVNEEGGVGAKVRDINRSIQATKQNFNSANGATKNNCLKIKIFQIRHPIFKHHA